MVGLQWCKPCKGPRFKWSVRDVDEIPERCLECGKDEVEVRLVAENLAELRRAVGQWALGDNRPSGHAGWLNRRKTRVQERFDQVIGWWTKQESQPAEFKRLLREYRNRGKPLDQITASEPEITRRAGNSSRKRLDADRLHELTQQLKAAAEQDKTATVTAPKEPVRTPGAWRSFQRPPQQTPTVPNLDSEREPNMVKCTLSGGDKDPREIDIPLMYCGDTIRVECEVWFARQQNGDVAVMKGGNRRAGNWMHFFTDVYHKVDKAKDNRATYTFEKTLEVNRCEATTKKGQRCRNEALEDSEFCNTHVLRTS